ncbi:hypothetical protein [Thermococcus sp. Bubb.Bath]|uniref:hypothetical protein n=1 Tax=Thermococcus sp. Bubb.Bath TaxID=1638242 RepID=UPI00143BF48B|nr:hypothetical protein [Thermococcus sp. Bubb.Bath]NJF25522.1 hypothetical protein [Thermococcus sp. Bubb.Bath]
MERLRIMMRRESKGDPIDYVKDLSSAILEGKLVGEEVLFRDAVGEIYNTLRRELFEGKSSDSRREKLVEAYELAVILRYLVQDGVKTSREILEELVKVLS